MRVLIDPGGFPARAMAKNLAGDRRDLAHVRLWVEEMATDLADYEQAGAR